MSILSKRLDRIESKRLDRIERNRPALGADEPLNMEALPRDVAARILAALADGTFPHGLSDADLEAAVAVADEQGAT